MKKFLPLILLATLGGCGYETVRPGTIGIKVPLYGSEKNDVQYQLVSGRVWYNSFYSDVYVFPTFLQQVIWDKAGPGDESITFNSVEGKPINCDVAFSYSIRREKISEVFSRLRRDINYITNFYLRSKVRDAFVLEASEMHVSDILGGQKQELLDAVKKRLTVELGDLGFDIDQVSIVGQIRVDAKVEESISQTIQAQQQAITAQNTVARVRAEAEQAVALARGKSDAAITEAEGAARARLLNAESEAKSNHLIQESLSEDVLRYQALRKWDGRLPTFNGSNAVPFIQVTP